MLTSLRTICVLGFSLLFCGTLFEVAAEAKEPVPKTKQIAREALQSDITLVKPDLSVATLTAELINTAEVFELNLPGVKKTQRGPRLKELIGLAGVEDFSEVRVFGYAKGRIATAEYAMKSAMVHDQVLLSFSRRGTVKLVVPELSFDDWIVDVYRLELK